jgi:hypothetical protein
MLDKGVVPQSPRALAPDLTHRLPRGEAKLTERCRSDDPTSIEPSLTGDQHSSTTSNMLCNQLPHHPDEQHLLKGHGIEMIV